MNVTSLLLAVGLLLGNAFFVGAEFAVISARRSQVEPYAAAGRRSARTTLWAMENVSLMLAASQLGITVCSLALGAVAEPALATLVEPALAAVHLSEDLVHPVSLTFSLALVIYLHVVVGEVVPKNLALAGPERAALLLAPPLVLSARVLAPFIVVLRAATNGLLRLFRIEPKAELTSAFTAEEVHSILAESRREGLIEEQSHTLLTASLELGERTAGDLVVPWGRLVTVPLGVTPAAVEAVVARTGFSRFPVLPTASRAADRDIVGYLHLKDLLYADDDRHELPVPEKRIRPLVTVREDEDAEGVLAALRRSGAHLARVVSDSGVVIGVVFLEDVLEELVGEVRDAAQRPVPSARPARAERPGVSAGPGAAGRPTPGAGQPPVKGSDAAGRTRREPPGER